MSSLDHFLTQTTLPSMSEVAHALVRTLNTPEASATEVRNILAKDAALSAKLLRLANSASYGLPRGVGTLDEALAMVGMEKVRALALGACLNDCFPKVKGLDPADFWKSNMACAAYAQWLAAHLEIDTQMAWLTGLLLRLGELLILQADPGALAEIEQAPQKPGERWMRERQHVGFTEGELTAELARRWNFPMQIVQALQRADQPLVDQAFSRLGGVVHLAGLLADMPDADAQAIDMLPDDVLDSLKLDLQWMRDHFPASNSFVDITTA
jgi:HD-like signal output (HDOD) protein